MALPRAVPLTGAWRPAAELRDLVHIPKQYLLRNYQNINNTMNMFFGGFVGNHGTSEADFTSIIDPPESTDEQKWDLREGKGVHAHMLKRGMEDNIFYTTQLLTMYAKSGSLADARLLFHKMGAPNVFSWTAMITGYARHGDYREALVLYNGMLSSGIRPDTFIFPSVLKACAALVSLQWGEEIHACIVRSGFESDVFVGSALVDMYAKCERLECARKVFDEMSERSVVSWNATIAGHAQNGQDDEALKLFRQMQQEGVRSTWVTIIIVLPACAKLGALQQGKEIHGYVIRCRSESNVMVGSALVDMYMKCGSKEDARQVFEKMPERNVVSWNTMIAGHAQSGQTEAALKLFSQMQLENVKPDLITWNAMIAGCAQNGYGNKALKLYHQMQLSGITPDVISCTAMIAGYVQNGQWNEAVKFFHQMQKANLKPNSVTIASVLPACANLAALQQGKEIHTSIVRSGFYSDVFVGSALLDMYAKCGNIEDAHRVFGKVSHKNVALWNAMIAGYAMHGHGKHALRLFHLMQWEDEKPNHITFIGVLSACSHAGLVDEGRQYFDCMTQDYQIKPGVEHYACMVDLLGRAGCLDEAYDLIATMSSEPNICVWGALLNACRIHGNMELGKWAAERLFELEPESTGSYVLLSNIHAAVGSWDDVAKVRKMMKEKGVRKSPGCSWIEIKNKVHVFLVGDKSHPQMENVYAMLESLSWQMKAAGYVLDKNYALDDVGQY